MADINENLRTVVTLTFLPKYTSFETIALYHENAIVVHYKRIETGEN